MTGSRTYRQMPKQDWTPPGFKRDRHGVLAPKRYTLTKLALFLVALFPSVALLLLLGAIKLGMI